MSWDAYTYRNRRRTFWEWLCDIDWFCFFMGLVCVSLTAFMIVGLFLSSEQRRGTKQDAIDCAAAGGQPFRLDDYNIACLHEGTKK